VDEEVNREQTIRVDGGEPSVYLDWALRSPDRLDKVADGEMDEGIGMDDMRREISRLQLDMLRLGRLMKVGTFSYNSRGSVLIHAE
jgi:hypothetical protein